MPTFILSISRPPLDRPSTLPSPTSLPSPTPVPVPVPVPRHHFIPIPIPIPIPPVSRPAPPMPSPAAAMPAPYSPARLSDASDASADSFGTAPSSASTASDHDPVLSARLRALNLSSVAPARAKRHSHDSDRSRASSADIGRALSLSPISSVCGSAECDDPRSGSSGRLSSSASLSDVLRIKQAAGKKTELFSPHPPLPPLAKSVSARTLEIPRGRVECIPRPPRPETPRQLPRPRVFIKQNSGKSTNDTDFERFVMRDRDEGSNVTRGSSERVSGWARSPEKTVTELLEEDDEFFFSDEESEAGVKDVLRNPIKKDPFGGVVPADALSSKVHRVLSNLRSISFQNPAVEDMDTAWGQAGPEELSFRKNNNIASHSRWRRPRGRISSKNGVQEFECYSEADAGSMQSYGSGSNAQRELGYNGTRDAIRGLNNAGGRHKKSLWNGGGRRDRSPPMAAQFLVGNNRHGYLAAATTLNEPLHTVTAMVPADTDTQERRRGSVDKYVEFIHASAQRESKSKMSRNFTGRVIHRAQGLFRRKWKV